MKRYVKCTFDPETNPTDAARSCVDTLNSDITKLHNIVSKWSKIIKEKPDNNSAMNKIIDDSTYIQQNIDKILEHYMTTMYDSSLTSEK